MSSSLHVSLPDEMRNFVDHRTNGKRDFLTPSEYIRSLIRGDMEKEAEKRYVYQILSQGSAEADRLEFVSSEEIDSVLKEFE